MKKNKSRSYFKYYVYLHRYFINVKRTLMFQYLFTVATETLVSLLIAGILWGDRSLLMHKFIPDRKVTFSEVVTNMVGISLLFLSIVVTILYFLMITVISVDTIKENKFTEYIGFMLERLNIESRLTLFYNFWFTFRRITIVIIAIFLKEYTGIQL